MQVRITSKWGNGIWFKPSNETWLRSVMAQIKDVYPKGDWGIDPSVTTGNVINIALSNRNGIVDTERHCWTLAELTAAITTLSVIRDAMAAND